MSDGRRPPIPRWARTLLELGLLFWPASRRSPTGHGALRTAEELLQDARLRGAAVFLRETVAEAASLARGGLALRSDSARVAIDSFRSGFWTELRLSVRSLRRSPGFTLSVVGTLALGLGANGAVFGLVDRILLRPPPYDAPRELVTIWTTVPGSDERIPLEGPDVFELRTRSSALGGIAFAGRPVDGSMSTGHGAEVHHAVISAVTWDLFHLLGVAPSLGRGFTGDDGFDRALVSWEAWQSLLGGDPGVVGGEVLLNGWPVTVVGVMPVGFTLASPPDSGLRSDVDVWTPLSVPLSSFHRTDDRLLDQDSDNSGLVIGRLAAGRTVQEAQAEADGAAAELRRTVESWRAAELGFSVRELQTDMTEHARGLLVALFAGSVVVLLVACLNIATLILGRGVERRGEFAVRTAIGAGRVRIVRQMAIEAVVLVSLGAVGAWFVAQMTLAHVGRRMPPALLPPQGVDLTQRGTAFTVALASGVALLMTVLPWLQARRAMAGRGFMVVGRGPSGRGRRQRNALVVGEVAFSVVLLFGAGMLLLTAEALRRVDPGFSPKQAVTFELSLRTPDRFRSPAIRSRIMKDIADGIRDLPEVRAVGLSGVLPLTGDRWTQPYGLPGQAESDWHANRADFRMVSSGYFDALGARLLEGRGFTSREDIEEAERVVVVDEKLARRVAPGGSALGARIGLPLDGSPVDARIVGVVGHIRHDNLDSDGREAIFVPYRQEASRDVSFVVRYEGGLAELTSALRDVVHSVDPTIPVHGVRTLEAYVSDAVASRTLALVLLSAFAGLGLLCSALGLYGVLALDVSSRTRDIGVRMAIGATRAGVVRHVLLDGLRLALLGLLLGSLLVQPAARVLQGLIFGVARNDPLLWLAVSAAVLTLSLGACLAPALAASRLLPRDALRAE